MGKMNKTIALDIGGVCTTLHFGRMLKRLGVDSANFIPPAAFTEMCTRFEKGLVPQSEWLASFREASGNRFRNDELIEIWNSVIGEAVDGMYEAVRSKIASGFRFVYFSNTSSLHMDAFFSTNSFTHLVSGGVYSYETHLMKPDFAMYKAFEAKYGVPYAYFDDRLENIEAALEIGWNAIHFTSARDLENLE